MAATRLRRSRCARSKVAAAPLADRGAQAHAS